MNVHLECFFLPPFAAPCLFNSKLNLEVLLLIGTKVITKVITFGIYTRYRTLFVAMFYIVSLVIEEPDCMMSSEGCKNMDSSSGPFWH